MWVKNVLHTSDIETDVGISLITDDSSPLAGIWRTHDGISIQDKRLPNDYYKDNAFGDWNIRPIVEMLKKGKISLINPGLL